MSANALSHMQRGGAESVEKDPITGMYIERASGYAPRLGGVRIPSAEEGTGGGQRGVSAGAPMPYKVVIGIPGQGGIELDIDPTLITPAEHKRVMESNATTDDRYKALAELTRRKKMQHNQPAPTATTAARTLVSRPLGAPRPPMPVQPARTASAAPIPAPPAPAAAPVPASRAPAAAPAPAAMGAPAGGLQDSGNPPQMIPETDTAVDVIDQQIAALQRQREQVIRDQEDEAARAASAASLAPAAAPEVAVNFVYPDGQVESGYYHQAALEVNESLLVLTVDNRGAGGQILAPRVFDTKTPIGIGVGAPNGVQVSMHALSLGMIFPVGEHYTVLVFPVHTRLS